MTAPRQPLRVGLLLDEPRIPWWIAPAVTQARERGILEVALAVTRTAPPGRTAPRVVRWWRNRRVLGYALLERLDRWRVRNEALPPDLELVEVCPGIPTIQVAPELTRFSDRLTAEDVERVRLARLDLLIRVGFRILRGPILSVARHGVWSFHHGDNRLYRGGPAGVWEVLEDRFESGVTLQRLTEELDGGQVLARTICATRRFSFEQNQRNLLRHTSNLLLTSLERLHRGDDPVQAESEDEPRWDAYSRPLYRIPTNGDLWRHLPRLGRRYLRQRFRSAGRKFEWSLGWHYADSSEADAPSGVFHRYREIRPPDGRFWADPFVVRDGSRWWMFFEEFQYARSQGEIGVWEFGPSGPVGRPRMVLRRPYHLSYPQVFSHAQRWWMLPEAASQRRVELYVADRFPDGWTLHATLLEGVKAMDATILSHEGIWYLFTSIEDELHGFYAPDLFGPFRPHLANPLVSDVRRARMAGRFFHSRGRLFRPAQQGSPRYGSGLMIHEVLELTPRVYRERVIHGLEPEWDRKLMGMHTLNAAEGLSVVDFLRLVRR